MFLKAMNVSCQKEQERLKLALQAVRNNWRAQINYNKMNKVYLTFL